MLTREGIVGRGAGCVFVCLSFSNCNGSNKQMKQHKLSLSKRGGFFLTGILCFCTLHTLITGILTEHTFSSFLSAVRGQNVGKRESLREKFSPT